MERFNYYEFVKGVERTCRAHPLVSGFYTERYRLSTSDDVSHPAVMKNNGREIGGSVTCIDFNLLYVNRLTESRQNLTEIQCVGADAIAEIVNALRNQFDMDVTEAFKIRILEEQFADNVAGAFGAVRIKMASNIGACDWLEVPKGEEGRR